MSGTRWIRSNGTLAAVLLLLALGCHSTERASSRKGPAQSVAVTTNASAPSAVVALSAVVAPSAGALAPYAVRPAVYVKYTLADGTYYGGVNAEPGAVLGPKQQFVKAFDCESKSAPRPSIIRVCVGFKACDSVTPPADGALAEIACRGPDLRLLLIADGDDLVFKVREPEHALAKRPMSRLVIPPGARPELGPFLRKNVTANVDL